MMHPVEKENAMNRKRKVFLVIIFCMGVFCGCGSRNNVYLETIQRKTARKIGAVVLCMSAGQ